ncbi:hypothetical protein GWC95_15620 [Sediminibacterium roseum]|uniref:Beta-lactamase superfamily domain-containing protein n=1 Tax=Sediminibacterium roseum TaxID=1978412 RepID=A0ABX0A093_9BACT|nr:hypothetical protein [Sediminibacterium roseum]NCI51357.1 hypothetical protein [Sediminibacterium roseum]
MSHNLLFFPLGNADTTLLKLNSGKRILFDYANTKTGDPDDLRCDLPEELDKHVTNDYYDAVGFTHADLDHVQRFSEYFHLRHAKIYQGEGRKKINDLWVPAQVILEEGCEDETRILRAEARYRLRQKTGIKVFSKPNKLKDWLKKEGIPFEEVQHLIVDAGKSVPGWGAENPEVEFFAHAPFAYTIDADTEINRNDACMVLQATFTNQQQTKFLLLGDADWQLLDHVIAASERFGNEHRLNWDIVHIAHHMSYKSLAPEKGETITEPVGPVKKLFEEHAGDNPLLISPSCPVPAVYDTVQPPHKQANNYYQSVADDKDGELQVTMSFPNSAAPRAIEIVVNNYGTTLLKTLAPAGFVTDRRAPKAG